MKKIIIDLGHGGKDSGAVNGNTFEKDIVYSIGAYLKGQLDSTHIKYKFTRTSDNFVSLNNRVGIANTYEGDYFISIHLNSASNNIVRGCEVLQYSTNNNTLNDFSNNVNKDISNYLDIKDRGIKIMPQLTVLKNTKMPACIIEIDFISNDMAVDKLKKVGTQKDISNIIFENIKKLIGYETKYYRVCVGSFSNKSNAIKTLKNVKIDYPDAFII